MVLVILALVMSGGMMALSGLRENADRAETEKSLEEIREALVGFALTYGRLPCPANPDGSAGGAEDSTGTVGLEVCSREVGILPWEALNVKPNDAWGRWYTYHVSANAASEVVWADGINLATKTLQVAAETGCVNPTSATVALCTEGDITVNDDDGTTLSTQAVAVVVSHGRDGAGAFESGNRIAVSASANQAQNTDALNDDGTVNGTPPDGTYIDGDYNSVSGSEFDDLILWISPNLIKNKLVEAKKLP